MPKTVDDLVLQDGIEIPDDPLAIEAMLEEEETAKGSDDPGTKGKEGDQPTDPTKQGDEGKPGDDKGQQDDPSKDDPSKQAPDQSKGTPEPKDEPPAGPPQAVLRRERENRHKAETLLTEREQELDAAKAKIAELEAAIAKGSASQDQLQKAADRATGDPSIKLEALDKAKLDALRRDLDDETVDFLGKLVDQHNALLEQTERLKRANDELIGERDRAQAASQSQRSH